jgi:hypothetical protein
MRCPPIFALVLTLALTAAHGLAITSTEPGAISLEDILAKPLHATVAVESIIYYQSDLQRALGGMGPGTVVQLVAMKDALFKVRGRAHHGDVAGWMRLQDLKFADPAAPEKLKAFAERHKIVDEMVQKHQIAIGMTMDEVKASLGAPARKSAKITAEGREETLEYIAYKDMPQTVTGRDRFGNLVQSVVYVKTEVGRLSVILKGGATIEIQETQGNPLPGAAAKIVPAPITLE